MAEIEETPPEELLTAKELIGPLMLMRNIELQVLWSRFNIYLLVNSGLLFAYFSTPQQSVLALYWPVGPALGLFLTSLWLLSESRGRDALDRRDRDLRNLRGMVRGETPSNLPPFRPETEIAELYEQSRISRVLIWGFGIGWSLLAVATYFARK